MPFGVSVHIGIVRAAAVPNHRHLALWLYIVDAATLVREPPRARMVVVNGGVLFDFCDVNRVGRRYDGGETIIAQAVLLAPKVGKHPEVRTVGDTAWRALPWERAFPVGAGVAGAAIEQARFGVRLQREQPSPVRA